MKSPLVDRNGSLILTGAGYKEIFDDCACSGMATMVSTFNLEMTDPLFDHIQWVQPNEVYSSPLPGGYHLVANPFSLTGPVVMNEVAWQRWQNFKQPSGMAVAVDKVFWEYRLLQPDGVPYHLTSASQNALTAWLHVTSACNMRCSYCYISKFGEQMSQITGEKTIEAILGSAQQHDFRKIILKYAGGEPTLNFSRVLSLHNYAAHLCEAAALELDGVILSNGLVWTDEMIHAVQTLGLRVMISCDGLGISHDVQRCTVNGSPTAATVMETLDRLTDAQVDLTISVTITGRNLTEIPDLVARLLQRKQHFTLNFYRENDCAATQPDLNFETGQVIATFQKIFTLIEANLPSYPVFGSLLDRARLDKAHTLPCGVGDSYLVVNTLGQIAKCHMLMDRPITDINNPDVLSVIKNDPSAPKNISVDLKENCHDCQWRYWCAGGCPILNDRTDGSFDQHSQNCEIYRTLFPEVLRLEGLRLLQYGLPVSM